MSMNKRAIKIIISRVSLKIEMGISSLLFSWKKMIKEENILKTVNFIEIDKILY